MYVCVGFYYYVVAIYIIFMHSFTIPIMYAHIHNFCNTINSGSVTTSFCLTQFSAETYVAPSRGVVVCQCVDEPFRINMLQLAIVIMIQCMCTLYVAWTASHVEVFSTSLNNICDVWSTWCALWLPNIATYHTQTWKCASHCQCCQ